MSAHVLLNLLSELRKRGNMRGLQSIVSLFCNKFNKFNKTGARIIDSIYHMTLKLFQSHIFVMNKLGFCHIYMMLKASFHNVTKNM